jgi:hypothetical protein
MNLIGFKREPEGAFYLMVRGSCGATQPQLGHPSATAQSRVPKATGQGISIRDSAPYSWMLLLHKEGYALSLETTQQDPSTSINDWRTAFSEAYN